MKQIFLNSTVVYYPKRGLEYVLNVSGLSPVTVMFYGSHFDNTIKFDTSTAISIQKEFENDQVGTCYQPQTTLVRFIPRESLPNSLAHKLRSPIVCQVNRLTQQLRSVSKIVFQIDNGQINLSFEWYDDLTTPTPLYHLSIPNFPIAVKSTFPAFRYPNSPNFELLERFMENFAIHNSEKNLIEQLGKTPGWCQIRAHFISFLLSLYGIPSCKIIALYHEEDWRKYRCWEFHVAVIVFDSKMKPWVIDPWVFGPWLINPEVWLNSPDLPKPFDVKVANPIVAFDRTGAVPDGANFYSMRSEQNVGIMQYLISSCIPNTPEGLIITIEDRLLAMKKAAALLVQQPVCIANITQLQ